MKFVKPFLITLFVIVIVSFIGYRFYLAYLPQPVRLQGQIEAQQYTISSKIAGRIDQVLVKKGDLIKKGDPIFTILSPEIEAKLEQAIANKDAASAMAQQTSLVHEFKKLMQREINGKKRKPLQICWKKHFSE